MLAARSRSTLERVSGRRRSRKRRTELARVTAAAAIVLAPAWASAQPRSAVAEPPRTAVAAHAPRARFAVGGYGGYAGGAQLRGFGPGMYLRAGAQITEAVGID